MITANQIRELHKTKLSPVDDVLFQVQKGLIEYSVSYKNYVSFSLDCLLTLKQREVVLKTLENVGFKASFIKEDFLMIEW